MGHAFLIADFHSLGDESIGRPLVIVLGHGEQLNDARDSAHPDHPDIAN